MHEFTVDVTISISVLTILAHRDLGQHVEAGATFGISPDGVPGNPETTSPELRKLHM